MACQEISRAEMEWKEKGGKKGKKKGAKMRHERVG